MKKNDLTHKQFGKLIVQEMLYGVQVGSKKRTFCVCLCDCGNVVTVVSDGLVAGKKTSCGCDTAERRSQSLRKDLSGQTFGRLSVLSMDWARRPTKALCRCQCGNTHTVIATQLTSGKTQSCGCLQSERASLSNVKDWTSVVSPYGVAFLSQAHINNKGQWLWNCKCGICQRSFVALPAKVMNGHITSCGCRRQSSREQLIRNELKKLNASFIEQFSFPDCKYKQVLLFDFAVFINERLFCLIEYDGKQHYQSIPLFGGDAEYRIAMKRDEIKNQYCKQNGISLIRLPYTLSDEEILTKVRDIIIRRDCNTVNSNIDSFAVLPKAG